MVRDTTAAMRDEESATFRPPNQLRARATRSVPATWARRRTGVTMGALRPTVLIVDDHAGFRASARALLEAEGFDVVAEAADAAQAMSAAARLRPAIVLLDIQLPDLDGFAVAARLADATTAVVLVSSRETVAHDPRMAVTAARGFLPKSRLSGEALTALLG